MPGLVWGLRSIWLAWVATAGKKRAKVEYDHEEEGREERDLRRLVTPEGVSEYRDDIWVFGDRRHRHHASH